MPVIVHPARCSARAAAAAAAVSAAAIRYGHNFPNAKTYADAARRMVLNGHTAGSAIASAKRRAKSAAPSHPVA